MTKRFTEFIDSKIKEKWSPEQESGRPLEVKDIEINFQKRPRKKYKMLAKLMAEHMVTIAA